MIAVAEQIVFTDVPESLGKNHTRMQINNDSHADTGALNVELAEPIQVNLDFNAQLDGMNPRLKILRRVRKCVQAVYADADREEKHDRRKDTTVRNTPSLEAERRNKPDRNGWNMAI